MFSRPWSQVLFERPLEITPHQISGRSDSILCHVAILLFLVRHKGSYTNVVAVLSGTLAQLTLSGLHTLIAVAELPAAAATPDRPDPNVFIGWRLQFLSRFCWCLDLTVFHKHSREPSLSESAFWTCVWSTLAFSFNGLIWWWLGNAAAVEFLTGYLVEWSLSMDNVFVFAVVFGYFGVPLKYQYRVLFWGNSWCCSDATHFCSCGC